MANQFMRGVGNQNYGGYASARPTTPNYYSQSPWDAQGGSGTQDWMKELEKLTEMYGGNVQGGAGKWGSANSPEAWNWLRGGAGANPYGGQARGWWESSTDPITAMMVSRSDLQTDPWEVINASKAGIGEQRDIGFGQAAQRMGQAGMLSSGSYAQELGGVQRKAENDYSQLVTQALYDASKFNSDKEMQAALANQGAKLQADMASRNNLAQAAAGLSGMGAEDLNRMLRAGEAGGQLDLGWHDRDRNSNDALIQAYMGMREGDLNRGYGAWGQSGNWNQENMNRAQQDQQFGAGMQNQYDTRDWQGQQNQLERDHAMAMAGQQEEFNRWLTEGNWTESRATRVDQMSEAERDRAYNKWATERGGQQGVLNQLMALFGGAEGGMTPEAMQSLIPLLRQLGINIGNPYGYGGSGSASTSNAGGGGQPYNYDYGSGMTYGGSPRGVIGRRP